MTWFNKYYRCPCGTEWQDEWDCLCDDRCPTCGTSCELYDYAEIDLNSEDKAIQDAILHGIGTVQVTATDLRSILFIMLIRKDVTNEKDTLGADRTESDIPVDDPVKCSKSSDDIG